MFSRYMPLLLAALIVGSANDAWAEREMRSAGYEGIQVVALGPSAGAKYDVSIMPAKEGLERLIEALKVIYNESEFNRDGLELLKGQGRVVIVYDPDHAREEFGTITAATFPPKALEISGIADTEDQLAATITRHGIKWPTRELAAIIVHELIGHGIQHQSGRLRAMRGLDVECEAWLRTEKAFQDFKLNKRSDEMVRFRRHLEYYCDDFRRSLGQNAALFDVLDPDIPRLMELFNKYLTALVRSGAYAKSVRANNDISRAALRRLYDSGSPQEQYNVGNSILNRSKIAEELKWGRALLHKAAKKGNLDAQYRIGKFLLEETEGDKRGKSALAWYRLAAKQGHIDAQFAAGLMLEKGQAIDKAPERAVEWYLKAAERGHAKAQFRLGILNAEGNGVPRDDKRAADWYLKAAKSGHPQAQSAIGYAYEKGRGTHRNIAKAILWYMKGAEQGYSEPQYNIGVMYAKGRGVRKDEEKALYWLTESAKQDHPLAQRVLGLMHEKGMGTVSDPKTAFAWYYRAARLGDKKAKKLAERLVKSHPEVVR